MINSQLSAIQMLGSINQISTPLSVSATTAQQVQKATFEILKRPTTPWVVYYAKHLPTYQKSHPGIRRSELMKKINTEWAKVADIEKEKMSKVYQIELETFRKKMEKIPQEKLEEIQAEKKAKKVEKAAKKFKQEKKNLLISLNKPKRPINAYLMYTMDRRPQLSNLGLEKEKTAKMAVEWKEANKELKDLYKKKQAEATNQYTKDLEKWEMKMQKEGKLAELGMANKSVIKIKKMM